VIEREFEIIEKSNKSGLLEKEQKLGYQSIHYLVKFSNTRCDLPEYARFKSKVTEVQVRTILQHAWAEIEHDIQYKAVETIPGSIRRRFTSLAGLLEIADREFQSISSEDERVRSNARRLVAQGALEGVEVTPDALRAYLDDKFGPDGRMTNWSYEWETRVLKQLGFENLGQVDTCISLYDADHIGEILWEVRQGQLTRLEDVLLAAMGEEFVRRHPWCEGGEDGAETWWATRCHGVLDKLKGSEVELGTYAPEA
jgi:putative GTP pyrophosphokinase